MRSSKIASIATAGLILVVGALKVLEFLIDQRSPNAIWHSDVNPVVTQSLLPRTTSMCLSRFSEPDCHKHITTAISRMTGEIRAVFNRCIENTWTKSRCTAAAREALGGADGSAFFADLHAQAESQRIAAERARADKEARRQAELDAERREAATVMGSDDGRSYLLAAYNQRIAAAERECREHAGLNLIMQWHENAVAGDIRAQHRVREACNAIMRKQPFILRPDGRQSIFRYPIPPFSEIDYWGRSRCAEKGRDAWRCIKQSADAVRARQPYWGELDHEINAILRSLNIQLPGVSNGFRR